MILLLLLYIGRYRGVLVCWSQHGSCKASENSRPAAHPGVHIGGRDGGLPPGLCARGAEQQDSVGANQKRSQELIILDMIEYNGWLRGIDIISASS